MRWVVIWLGQVVLYVPALCWFLSSIWRCARGRLRFRYVLLSGTVFGIVLPIGFGLAVIAAKGGR